MRETLLLLLVACAARSTDTTRTIATATDLDHRGDLVAARAALARGLDGAHGDPCAEATYLAELARLDGTLAFSTNRGYEAGLARARAAQQAARGARADRAFAVATDAEGMLVYASLLWAGATDYTAPRIVFERAVRAFEQARDTVGVAQSTFHVGLTFEQAGDVTTAAQHYRRARDLGDDTVDSFAERHLAGLAAERGDLATARRGFARSLALRRQVGFTRLVPAAMIALADVDLKEGLVDPAVARYREALALALELGQPLGAMWAHLALGAGLEKSGARAEALGHYQQALVLAEQARVPVGIAAARSAIERH